MKRNGINGIKYNLNIYEKYKYERAHLCVFWNEKIFYLSVANSAVLKNIRYFLKKMKRKEKE